MTIRSLPVFVLFSFWPLGCGQTEGETNGSAQPDAIASPDASVDGHAEAATDALVDRRNDALADSAAEACDGAAEASDGAAEASDGAAEASDGATDAETSCDLSGGTVTHADQQTYFFDNPEALSICLPMLTCGLLEPEWDDNAVFPFTVCMILHAEHSAGRTNRLACVQTFAGDCAALEACVMPLWADTERSCDDGQQQLTSKQTGEVQGAYACDRVFTGGRCEGELCMPCGPSVTQGCGTPRESCESEGVYLDCIADMTYATTCGAGYHCTSEYNGPTAYWARCEGEGTNHCSEMEFVCVGDSLRLCTESFSPFEYDCLAWGFSGCNQGKCVW